MEARVKFKRVYEPWIQEEDEILKSCFSSFSYQELLSDLFGRSCGSIKSRIEYLKLI